MHDGTNTEINVSNKTAQQLSNGFSHQTMYNSLLPNGQIVKSL